MAIVKAAKTLVGKAINIAKKKKKELEVKGQKTKKDIKENIVKESQNIKDPSGKDIRNSIKGVGAVPDVMAGAVGQTATKVSGKAVNAIKNPKKTINKTKNKINNKAEKVFGTKAGIAGEVAGAAIGSLAAVATFGLGASIVKSNSSPEQEYTQKRLGDGRVSTTFGGPNGNAVFSKELLSQKEVDDVRTQLAILESIVLSDNPRTQRDEFMNTILLLSKKYGINNITGKNLSIIMPQVEKGEKKKLNVAQSGNMSKSFFK